MAKTEQQYQEAADILADAIDWIKTMKSIFGDKSLSPLAARIAQQRGVPLVAVTYTDIARRVVSDAIAYDALVAERDALRKACEALLNHMVPGATLDGYVHPKSDEAIAAARAALALRGPDKIEPDSTLDGSPVGHGGPVGETNDE